MKFLQLDKLAVREKTMLVVAGLLIAAALSQTLVVFPVFADLRKYDQQIEAKEKELFYCRSLAALKDKVGPEYAKVSGLIGKAESDSEAINLIKEEVDSLAMTVGLQADPPIHRDARKPKYWREYVVDVPRIEADMEHLLQFIQAISDAGNMSRVEKLVLQADRGKHKLGGSIVVTRVMISPDESKVGGAAE